jgi:hypothetical protein
MTPHRSLVALAAALVFAVFPVVAHLQRPHTAGPPLPPPATGAVADLLAGLRVAPDSDGASYMRDLFGAGWTTQPDGCTTREDVLAAETAPEALRRRDGCTIAAGDWVSLYDGRRTTDPAELEIDHVVALAEAWSSGASRWSGAQRAAFANDLGYPDALIAVTAATNQAKSDHDPAEWMPPAPDAWCRYATAWITQKARWQLTVDPAEHDALAQVLTACPTKDPAS